MRKDTSNFDVTLYGMKTMASGYKYTSVIVSPLQVTQLECLLCTPILTE